MNTRDPSPPTIDRRHVLQTGLATVAVASRVGAADPPEPRPRPVHERICVFTDHLDDHGFTYAEVAAHLEQLGIAGRCSTGRPVEQRPAQVEQRGVQSSQVFEQLERVVPGTAAHVKDVPCVRRHGRIRLGHERHRQRGTDRGQLPGREIAEPLHVGVEPPPDLVHARLHVFPSSGLHGHGKSGRVQ
jgi:hypothetical protein